MVRLSRKDAKELPSYLVESSKSAELPPRTGTQLAQDINAPTSAIDGV
jgi:hypothetical protein